MADDHRPLSDAPASGLILPRVWLRLGWVAALIAAAASGVGLLVPGRIYGQETGALADQAVAQDAVNLLVVAPLTVVLGIGAARGSVRAYVCWLGCLAFTAYSYAIYAFAIHFGPLFLPWLAVLGLSFYALAGSLAAVDTGAVRRAFAGRRLPVTAWTLIGLSVLFGLLWLREIIPDLLGGRPSTSAAALNLPTNPVHVLDLALFLPAALASGVLLLRREPLGYSTAPGVLVFVALTCLPILITPAVAITRGHHPSSTVLAPLGIVLAVSAAVLRRALQNARPPDMTTVPSTTAPPSTPDPQKGTTMAKNYRLGPTRKAVNTLISAMVRIGIGAPSTYLLTTTGAKSGRPRTTPVVLVETEAGRWLVSPYGNVGWVHNVRAHPQVSLRRGHHTHTFQAREVNSQTAGPILQRYLRQARVTAPFFKARAGDPDQAFAAEATQHPVFTLT